METILVRHLLHADIPGAMRLKEAAAWNQTGQDWANVLELEPDGCFAVECDGVLAATATAVCFGRELAWIGMVLTAPEYRGRGFARRLMESALEYLEARRIEWIKLDATDMGRPLYARLGFRDECLVERWLLAPERNTWTRNRAPDLAPGAPDLELDRAAFGADRSAMLGRLGSFESASMPGGYAMGRPGTKAAYFGPCVARNADTARCLLEWFLANHAGEGVFWDILPENAEALRLAQEFGFEHRRRLVRMARPGIPDPPPFVHNDCSVYAIAGFEYG
jgi:GNAT superfamily N-acetyltransferase